MTARRCPALPRVLAAALATYLVAATSGSPASALPTLPRAGHAPAATVPNVLRRKRFDNVSAINTTTPIKHVIIVVMENRSFDNLFHGFPGADSANFGYNHLGQLLQLQPAPFEGNCDPDHSHEAWVKDYNVGQMNGWDTTPSSCVGPAPTNGSSIANYPYGYVPYFEAKPYFDVAAQFGLADRMFASQTGPSYPGHMFIVAGTSGNQTDDPSNPLVWGCDSPAGTTVPYLDSHGNIAGTQFPCLFQQQTMGNELDAYGIPWAYYSNNLSYTATGQEYDISTQPYDAFYLVRNTPDWQNNIIAKQGVAREFYDIQNGGLPAVSWFNPPVIASDHAQATTNLGPDYVAALVDALMTSPAGYWNDTALFVTWDDPGGWYDHVAPQQLDNNGLGFRVPLIVVSKYAKRGYVSHMRHEYASMLKFIEANWRLPTLGTTDRRADDLADFFDFSPENAAKPTKQVNGTHSNVNAAYFQTQVPLDTQAVDYTPQEK